MDIKKLQTLVVDALEDVKAQEIRIFDTTHLTSLFDRVAIASGTSNRQTKALASSVRDKVKAKGGNVISIEGEDTGEWVLVDLGDMIVHIMQPAIRTYYRLEEIWGDKEVKLGAAKRTGTSAAAKRVADQAGETAAPKIRRTRAQAEAVEASQALDDDDDAPKKPARKPRTTTATGTAATASRRTAGTAATTRTTRTTTGTKATAPKTKTTTTRSSTAKAGSKTAAPKTPAGKTVRVAAAKSATAKKPAAKRAKA
ncbi:MULTISPECIES: ribosome silencing factor [unclassified Herbaspirillum]|uniref:ribosome silencing factor n=1 Tax=unclassified Herbaspirillum TaxID=2624150 RepID=UPI001152FCCF|nr:MULTISPECIES: ribosome silencing factor [unclassified Herbaspirillum]MBB5391416.1 ribosome-associated protein [Herbaspirillum sp. SJZ102]TQK12899.1 ribosome-associated protein [Herbaspirillum sp. SJZ130]TQK14903.1 ribosome-associated protein [Herbaspirillum sp. SJZ106]